MDIMRTSKWNILGLTLISIMIYLVMTTVEDTGMKDVLEISVIILNFIIMVNIFNKIVEKWGLKENKKE